MSANRFVTCIKCAYVMSWLEHTHLSCSMPCPACGAEEQFGPGVYTEEFDVYTWAEVMRKKAAKSGARL